MHVVIFSGGIVKKSPLLDEYIRRGDLFIAADSGAATSTDWKITPNIIIGDFDSIDPLLAKKLEKKGAKVLSYPHEKDETDTELALNYAVKQGATDITLIGGNDGDRFDHVLANLFLGATSTIPVRFINGNQLSWVIKGPTISTIQGEKGELISLIPLLADAEGVTLDGLQYSLQDETLLFGKPRGISNVFTKKTATVSLQKGMLLLIHTYS